MRFAPSVVYRLTIASCTASGLISDEGLLVDACNG